MFLKVIFFLLILVFLIASNSPVSMALSRSSLHSIHNNTVWYSAEGSSAGCTPSAGSLPSFVPEPYNGSFTTAAKAHNTSPALIAALFTEENFTGIDPPKIPGRWADFIKKHPDPNSGWGVNPDSQAAGPFQFIPSTWGPPVNMGEDGDGDGNKDVNNLMDAAHGAANYAERGGATLDKPVDSWRKFIFSYNHADWYVQAVYKYYYYYAKGGNETAGVSPGYCGGGVSPDGFVFPMLTTKGKLADQNPYTWNPNCTNSVSEMGPGSSNPERKIDGLCHHTYLAADIFNTPGTPVVTVRPGRIVSAHDGGDVGMTVRLYSDKALGGDGLWYYFAHMLKAGGGGGLAVQVDDIVQAGDKLGKVGTSSDAQSTQPHLHFDVSRVENGFSRGRDGTDGPLLDPMPALKKAYEGLPGE